MERTFKNVWRLFTATFFLSAFTFGGGYVIITLMKKKFVDELKWLGEEEMLNMAAMAQSSPGAIAVNAAILVGWRTLGFTGAIIAVVGTILPPLIILSVVSLFYAAFKDNRIVSAVLKGMMAGVCAVIFDVVANLGSKVVKERKWLPMLIMAGAFAAHFVCRVNVVYIIITCALLGAGVSIYDRRNGKEHL